MFHSITIWVFSQEYKGIQQNYKQKQLRDRILTIYSSQGSFLEVLAWNNQDAQLRQYIFGSIVEQKRTVESTV